MNKILIFLIPVILFACSSNDNSERKQIDKIMSKGKKITNYQKINIEQTKNIKSLNKINLQKAKIIKNWTHVNFNVSNKIPIANLKNDLKITKSKAIKSSNVLFTKNNTIVVSNKGKVYILDQNLKLIKKLKLKIKRSKNFNLILNSAIYNNSLIISDNLGYIRKIDMDDLKIVWEKYLSVPFVSNLIINKKKIYVLNINSKIFCFKLEDGSQEWSYETASNIFNTPEAFRISVFSDKLIFSSNAGQITVLDLNNNKLIWQRDLRKFTIFSSNKIFKISEIIIENNVIYLSSNYGETLAIRLEDGTEIWRNKTYLKNLIISKKYIFGLRNNISFIIISKKNGKTLFSNRLAKKNEKIKYNSILLNKSYLLIGSKQKKSVMIKYSNLNTLKKVNYNFDKYIFLKDFAYLISEKKIVKVQ